MSQSVRPFFGWSIGQSAIISNMGGIFPFPATIIGELVYIIFSPLVTVIQKLENMKYENKTPVTSKLHIYRRV